MAQLMDSPSFFSYILETGHMLHCVILQFVAAWHCLLTVDSFCLDGIKVFGLY